MNTKQNPIIDENERAQALDPRKSFIVQAPAGSGKTELLTQRFLVLLAQVNQPEEILAITFTKKSAAEMRSRIIETLIKASSEPKEALSPHAQKTRYLAQQVLQRDQAFNWNIIQNPHRLRLQTIDSFNSSLTKRMPLLSQFGATPEITTEPLELYREAVQEFLSHLEENLDWSDAIAQLLLHINNDLNQVQALLISMLGKRDQWLKFIAPNAHIPILRRMLEKHLETITQDVLNKLVNEFPPHLADETLALAQFAAKNLESAESIQEMPGDELSDKANWLLIADLLLTKEDSWRKRIDKTVGFPANEKDMKGRMLALMEELAGYEELLFAFAELRKSPAYQYKDIQWETLDALHRVLLIVVAQLKIVFQQKGKIDFIENAQAAITALETPDGPTDLALALDYQIKHILVDEFQDTSNSQYRLLEMLTLGWSNQDGRTLFVVGDPMQSIYRFREADVGLFIRSRQKGIGNIQLHPLTLSVNFRSTPRVVNWVNQHFSRSFPAFEDIETGAVSYSMSASCKTDDTPDSIVQTHAIFDARDNEQETRILELIKQCRLENPEGTIAILVRSRTHLESMIPVLKNAGLAYRAIEIDPLNTKPTIQDLMALTRALLHPADRIAWLAILRAPWCGLSLSDLLTLTGERAIKTLWEQLQNPDVIAKLSPDGQQRLARVLPILKMKMADRRRYSLRLWVESTWLLLGGPACLEHSADLEDVNAYLDLLDNIDQGGNIANLDNLDEYVSKLYASPNSEADDTLQIMTIHNAKGLEFDTVILPHLQRKSSNDDKQLLLWMQRTSESANSHLILAPVHAVGDENDSIYEFIKRQNKLKSEYEMTRLLYVAATRAKKQLHLFFNLATKEDGVSAPIKSSLLEKIWTSIEPDVMSEAPANLTQREMALIHGDSADTLKKIKRLTVDWHNPISEEGVQAIASPHENKVNFTLPNEVYKHIGTVTHAILQQVGESGVDWWHKSSREGFIKNHLLELGVLPSELKSACHTVMRAVDKTLGDPRGIWILQGHLDAMSELPLTALINGKVESLKIDRTFVDDAGTRWIIDFKTADYSGDDVEGFLESEKREYAEKMLMYAEAMKAVDGREIRLGLYFPLLTAWKEWIPG